MSLLLLDEALEDENRRLKHVVAELSLEKRALSERQACRLIGLHRSTSRYERKRGEDKELRLRLRAWASRRRRKQAAAAVEAALGHAAVFQSYLERVR